MQGAKSKQPDETMGLHWRRNSVPRTTVESTC